MRGWWRTMGRGGLLLLLLGSVATGTAQACRHCTPYMTCTGGIMGAVLCYSDLFTCFQAGRCRGIIEVPDGANFALSILEDVPGAGPAESRTIALGGETGVGASAARLAARALGGTSSPAVVDAGLGAFEGGTALFRTPAGDGFALRLDRAGDRANVALSDLTGGRPGRPIALAELGADEALVARVTFEGRTRVVVFTAALRPATEAAARDEMRRAALREGATPTRAGTRPPFEVSVLDR